MTKVNLNSFCIGDRAHGWALFVCFMALLVHRPLGNELADFLGGPPQLTAAIVEIEPVRAGRDTMVLVAERATEPLTGFRDVEIRRGGMIKRQVCTARKRVDVSPGRTAEIKDALSGFTGGWCDLTPGRHELCFSYDMTDDDGARVTFGPTCEAFTVRP